MSSYQYRKSHCGDKTILPPSYLHNGISYTGKMSSLYWAGALAITEPADVPTHGSVRPSAGTVLTTILGTFPVKYLCLSMCLTTFVCWNKPNITYLLTCWNKIITPHGRYICNNKCLHFKHTFRTKSLSILINNILDKFQRTFVKSL